MADERSATVMLSKVVSQIARLFENTVASRVHAFKVQFDSLCIRIPHLDCLMPFFWNTLEGLGGAWLKRHDVIWILSVKKVF